MYLTPLDSKSFLISLTLFGSGSASTKFSMYSPIKTPLKLNFIIGAKKYFSLRIII